MPTSAQENATLTSDAGAISYQAFKHFYEYSDKKLRYRHIQYFISKLLAWWICTIEFAKKFIIEAQLTIKVNVWYEIACIRCYVHWELSTTDVDM